MAFYQLIKSLKKINNKKVLLFCFFIEIVHFPLLSAYGSKLPIHVSELKQWAGLYPHRKISGIELFQVRAFRIYLQKSFGKKKYKEYLGIEGNGVVAPVNQWGDFLHVFVCEAHNCIFHEFHFFINTKNSKIFICEKQIDSLKLGSEDLSALQTIWYSDKKQIHLFGQGCAIYSEELEGPEPIQTLAQIPAEIQK